MDRQFTKLVIIKLTKQQIKNIKTPNIYNPLIMNPYYQPQQPHFPTLHSIYTPSPIQQSTDRLNNQTSFVLNFNNAYSMKEEVLVESWADVKCRYCKGWYFPEVRREKERGNNAMSTRSNKGNVNDKNRDNNNQKQHAFVCQLCNSINDTRIPFISNTWPSFNHQPSQQSTSSTSLFQSILLTQSPKTSLPTLQKPNQFNQQSHKGNEIVFVFYLDVGAMGGSEGGTVVGYLSTVVREFFMGVMQANNQRKNSNSSQQMEGHQQQQQPYKHPSQQQAHHPAQQTFTLLLTMNHHDNLHICHLPTQSTLNVDSILHQKILSSIPSQNTSELYQKQNLRKLAFVELLNGAGVDLLDGEGVGKVEGYLGIIGEEMNGEETEKGRVKCTVNGSGHFARLVEMLAGDKNANRSYVVTWIGKTPLLNYQPHRVKNPRIHTNVYMFHQPPHPSTTSSPHHHPSLHSPKLLKPLTSLHHSQHSPYQSNIKSQLLLIRDNSSVHFIQASEQGTQQFYYKLYELFSTIVSSPLTMFRPRWSIKSDSKYPPLLTNDFPSFFISNNDMLMFIVSCLLDKGGSGRFQVSVVFENWRKQEQVWVINWEKDEAKERGDVEVKGEKHLRSGGDGLGRKLLGGGTNRHKQNLIVSSSLSLSHQSHLLSLPLAHKLPQLYNYLTLLTKHAINLCIRGTIPFSSSSSLSKKPSIFTSTSITPHQLCMVFESYINQGVFRTNNTTQVPIEYSQKLYEFFTQMKNDPFALLRFVSSIQISMRKAVVMMWPVVVGREKEEEVREGDVGREIGGDKQCVVYWGDGYVVVGEAQGYEGQDDEQVDEPQWVGQAIQTINEHEGKFYTRQYSLNSQESCQQHQSIVNYYLNKLNPTQNNNSHYNNLLPNQKQQQQQQYFSVFF